MAITLKLKRSWASEKSTIGLLYFLNELGESIFRCFTLEDVERNEKVFGMTAIPKGRYRLVETYSKKFKRTVWMLEDVPNFLRIYIHAGNRAEDTEGCILCGLVRGVDVIERSTQATAVVYELLERLKATQKDIYITVE